MRFPDDVPVLTDGEVTLRAHTLDDVPRVVEQCNDPVSIACTTVPAPYGPNEALEWIGTVVPKGWADDSDLCFALEHRGRFAGSLSLARWQRVRPRSASACTPTRVVGG